MKPLCPVGIGVMILLCMSLVGCHAAGGPSGDGAVPAQAPLPVQEVAPGPMAGVAAVPNDPNNILANPGFEKGLEGWQWLDWSKGWAPFALSTQVAYEGKQSLYLPVLSSDKRPTVVWGGVQEITLPNEIPECVEGYYYVDNWEVKDWKQYLQLVIIDLSHELGPNRGNAQLRYIITGSKEPPLTISNAQYLFMEKERRDVPVIKQWTRFSVDPRADFSKHWGYVPQKGSNLRVLFEGRFDHHFTDVAARGDVYFDNLYFGPRTAGHCADQ